MRSVQRNRDRFVAALRRAGSPSGFHVAVEHPSRVFLAAAGPHVRDRQLRADDRCRLKRPLQAKCRPVGRRGKRRHAAQLRGEELRVQRLERVLAGLESAAALDLRRPILERPANAVRSIARIFSSEVEDKSWFYDRKFWDSYLSLLAMQRFNQKANKPRDPVYGCVTTGTLWRFLRLAGKRLDIDLDEYQIAQADRILGVLLHCCGVSVA